MHKAVCIASGPSLTQADVDYCKGKAKIYVVKESYLMAPWADVLYAADTDWWELKKGAPDFAGEKWTVSAEAAQMYKLRQQKYRNELVWSNDPEVIATGGNSGFQALQLAVLGGASEVILLGYDMGYQGSQKHWWDKTAPRQSRPSDYEGWIKRYDAAAHFIPVPVYNCTPTTALRCFTRKPLREVL